jgi:hypothetical protein
MKAAPHPDKGGAPAPVLALPPGRERAQPHTLRRLFDLRLYVERELAAGPWDSWDGAVLEQWRDIVRDKMADAELDLYAQLRPPTPDYEIIDQ